MKVLAVQGSPHRGNTYRRVEAFGEALAGHPNIQFEHIELWKLDLEGCRGCFACFLKGREVCPIEDDGQMLLEKIRESDAVVFASPVYSMSISYLMKTFVDRFAFLFHRPEFFGKYAVGLAVTGGAGLSETLKYISMFSGSWGFEWLGELKFKDPPVGVDLPAFRVPEDRTEEVAERLVSALEEQQPVKPGFGDLMNFHIMRAIYARMADFLPEDHCYWKENGWLDKGRKYFPENSRVGYFKPVIPRLVGFVMGKMIDMEMKKGERET